MNPARATTNDENPFPGLLSFEPEQSKYFYGRNKQIEQILRQLQANRFLAVIGSSGCGKSSLIRAGLLPSLYRGYLGGPNWQIAIMKPGIRPVAALEAALATLPSFAGNSSFKPEALFETTRGLVSVAEPNLPPGHSLLIVVDQFEEIFRFRRESEAADAEASLFVDLLLHASSRGEGRIHVVLTMRTDYLSDCAQFEGLPEALNRGQFLVPRLTREERQEAIEGPLRFTSIPYSSRLVQQVLNDFGDDPNNLPALQHALHRTVEHWSREGRDGVLDTRHYEAVSASVGAIEKHCEQVYERLSPANRKLAEQIFRSLTTVDRGRRVRRPRQASMLRDITGGGARVQEVIDEFAAEGFIIKGSDGVADLTHESLITRWQRLKGWVDVEQTSAKWYHKLVDAAKHGLSPWRGRELEEARKYRREGSWNAAWASQYGEGFDEAMRFLDRSRRLRFIRLAVATALVLGTIIAVAVFMYWLNHERERAERERTRAETEKARAEKLELDAKSARDAAIASQKETAALIATSAEMKKRLLEEAQQFKLSSASFKDQANSKAQAAAAAAQTTQQPSKSEDAKAAQTSTDRGQAAVAASVAPTASSKEPAKSDPTQSFTLSDYSLQPIQSWEGRAALLTGEVPTLQGAGSMYFVLNLYSQTPEPILQKSTTDKSVVKELLEAAEGQRAGRYAGLRFQPISLWRDVKPADVLADLRTKSGAAFTISLKGLAKGTDGSDQISVDVKINQR